MFVKLKRFIIKNALAMLIALNVFQLYIVIMLSMRIYELNEIIVILSYMVDMTAKNP